MDVCESIKKLIKMPEYVMGGVPVTLQKGLRK